jgi:hypothetical protein
VPFASRWPAKAFVQGRLDRVKATLGAWVLTIACGPTPEGVIRADVARWPTPALAQGRIDFAQARLAYVRERKRWDVLNREDLEEEARELDRAITAWQAAVWPGEQLRCGYPDVSALHLEELRKLLGEEAYRAGRLPPLPDVARFANAD